MFVVVHVVTTVADGYTTIGLTDAVIPFVSPYRPVWLGLGAIAFDLLLRSLRRACCASGSATASGAHVHWLAYASWPIALVHAFGTGSDARLGWMRGVGVGCLAVVALAALRPRRHWLPAAHVVRGRGCSGAACRSRSSLVPAGRAPRLGQRAGTPTSLLASRAGSHTEADRTRGRSATALPFVRRARRNRVTQTHGCDGPRRRS